jgi:capsular polysaccharide biosynthesis protein
MMLEKEIKNYTILYPEGWKGKNFVNESLKLFPDLKTKIIESDNHMFVKKLVLPESKQWTNIFDPEITQQLRLRVWDYLKRNNISKNLGDKIYVSREKAKRRKVVNEVELTQYLEKMDFQIINFEDYTFWEQVAIMKDTKLLISVHGAGLANINFMPAHSFLIELTKKTNGNEIGRISYWRLSASLNINYLVQFCETQDDVNSYDSDIYVDWEQLQKNLSLISNFKLDIN